MENEIKGLDKLRTLEQLNVRACTDDKGWHLDIFLLQEGFDHNHKDFKKRIEENVVVDLAQENGCNTAEEVRDLYDKLMYLFHTRRLQKFLGASLRNGYHSIAPSVDKVSVTLSLSSYQLQLLQDGVQELLCGNWMKFDWDRSNPDNLLEFELLDMLHFTRTDKFMFEQHVKDKRNDLLNS